MLTGGFACISVASRSGLRGASDFVEASVARLGREMIGTGRTVVVAVDDDAAHGDDVSVAGLVLLVSRTDGAGVPTAYWCLAQQGRLL
jgi:hypothetical protein